MLIFLVITRFQLQVLLTGSTLVAWSFLAVTGTLMRTVNNGQEHFFVTYHHAYHHYALRIDSVEKNKLQITLK